MPSQTTTLRGGEAQKIIEKRKKERKTREEKERKRESIINRGVCARHYIGWVCAVGVLYIYTPLLSPPPSFALQSDTTTPTTHQSRESRNK
jgi:cell division septal protein FtsQ